MNFKFPSSERLKSKKAIELLFTEGKSVKSYPVKIFYLPSETIENTQATFAVPKRNFKSAVDRNRIKRQLKEVYRLHKQLLITNKEQKVTLLFLYLSKDKLPYATIEKAMVSALNKL
ncbi:MAG: ribonuclease P protein component [Flavobacteriaceae bacterium]|jgi:ribonuclease P protein component|uniref:ribonuclease P protein component n=1 Tax=Candidatus Marifrigoribacter sp. Uisw_064 TaxID=3230970 RepID=UPI003AEBE7F4